MTNNEQTATGVNYRAS